MGDEMLGRFKEVHQITDNIEETIREVIPSLERVVIHYEPEKRDFLGIEFIGGQGRQCFCTFRQRTVYCHVEQNDFGWQHSFQGGSGESVSEYRKGEQDKRAEFLVAKGIDMIYIRDYFEGESRAYVFSDADVEIRHANLKNLKELADPEKVSFQ